MWLQLRLSTTPTDEHVLEKYITIMEHYNSVISCSYYNTQASIMETSLYFCILKLNLENHENIKLFIIQG